jgi:hypothetical protein
MVACGRAMKEMATNALKSPLVEVTWADPRRLVPGRTVDVAGVERCSEGAFLTSALGCC